MPLNRTKSAPVRTKTTAKHTESTGTPPKSAKGPVRAPSAAPEGARAADELSVTEVADRLGISYQAVGVWAAKPGAPVRSVKSRVWCKWPAFARWREQQLVDTARREATPTVSLDEARTRKALAEAELAEIELARARGEVVALSDYEAALARILDRLAARLRALPVRLLHLGPEVEAAAEAEAEKVVEELHAWNEDVVDETPAQGSQQTTEAA